MPNVSRHNPSAMELEGWHRRAAERVVRTYADAPPELKAEARHAWPSLGDALDALARIDALTELADHADEASTLCDGCDEVTHGVRGTHDGRAQLCPRCIASFPGQPWSPGDPCASCGSTNTHWAPDTGAACGGCSRTDADE